MTTEDKTDVRLGDYVLAPNNLTELREQLQEDIIWYFACDGGDDGITIDEVLQIIDYCFPESTKRR